MHRISESAMRFDQRAAFSGMQGAARNASGIRATPVAHPGFFGVVAWKRFN
jgi:hypothetical protein